MLIRSIIEAICTQEIKSPYIKIDRSDYNNQWDEVVEQDEERPEGDEHRQRSWDAGEFRVEDDLHGSYTGVVDDFVLRRGDGTPAYNLAVVVDDAETGVDQVVRGDDLLSSAPRQAYLATLLGFAVPTYAHVPLVVNAAGVRLSKRDGAVTLEDLAVQGVSTQYVVNAMARSLGLAVEGEHATAAAMLTHFDPAALPRQPWVFCP